MHKVVTKTAFKTFIIVIVVLIVAFATASLGFPGQMATFFENMGSYSFATGYASLAYTYSGSYEDLARCVDDSILSEDDKNIVNFASQFVDRSGFEDYCKKRDEANAKNLEESGITAYTDYSYKQYVFGKLASSQYALGDRDAAIETAEKSMDGIGFPVNNAYVMLARRAYEKKDVQMKSKLYEKLSERRDKIANEDHLSKDLNYINQVLLILE